MLTAPDTAVYREPPTAALDRYRRRHGAPVVRRVKVTCHRPVRRRAVHRERSSCARFIARGSSAQDPWFG